LNEPQEPKRLKIGHVIFWLFLISVGIKVAVVGAFMMIGLFPHEVLIAFFSKLWTLGPTFMINGLIVSCVGFAIVMLCVWQLMRMSANCHKRSG